MPGRPYLIDPPQIITIEIRTSEGGTLTITGTVDSVPMSAGRMVQKMVIKGATVQPG